MVNPGVPKCIAVPAPLVTPVICFIKVHIPSQENKRSCLFVVSILPLFLRSLDYALEIFYQCAFLKNNIDMHIHKSSYHSDMKRWWLLYHLSPSKSTTNTTWFCSRLCKLQKGTLDSQLQVITFNSCLTVVGGPLRILRLLPPLTLVAMI
jgi:hypothetical protein